MPSWKTIAWSVGLIVVTVGVLSRTAFGSKILYGTTAA